MLFIFCLLTYLRVVLKLMWNVLQLEALSSPLTPHKVPINPGFKKQAETPKTHTCAANAELQGGILLSCPAGLSFGTGHMFGFRFVNVQAYSSKT